MTKTARTFPPSRVLWGPRVIANLERAERELSPNAYALYLISVLIADERGQFSKVDLAAALAQWHGRQIVAHRLADGTMRVQVVGTVDS